MMVSLKVNNSYYKLYNKLSKRIEEIKNENI